MAFPESNYHWLMSWRAILAGFFVAGLTYAVLFALGLGVGGLSLTGVVQSGRFQGFGVGTGIWLVVAHAIALFVGAYFAARISNLVTRRIGSAQGLVIAALFFAFMAFEAVSVMGLAASGISTTASAVGGVTSDLTSNVDVEDAVQAAIGDKTLKSSPDVVARELTTRLLSGNVDSAKSYLAFQTGQSTDDIDQQIQGLQNQIQAKAKEAGVTASRMIAGFGWMAFITLVIGSGCALWGGALGSRVNDRSPLDLREVPAQPQSRTA